MTALTNLVPHTSIARFLTEVVRFAPGFVQATGLLPANHPLVALGRAPAFLGIELGAQAAAALETLGRASIETKGAPRIGYLVGVRHAVFLRPDLPTDTPLDVTAKLLGAAAPLAIYHVEVSIAGVECLHASLSTHSAPDPQSFHELRRK